MCQQALIQNVKSSLFFLSKLAIFLPLQELSSLDLPPVWSELDSSSELNNVSVLNCMYDLIKLHHRSLRTLENMEVEQLKLSSNVDHLKLSNSHLKVK